MAESMVSDGNSSRKEIAMQTFTLARTELPDLTFTGRLLVRDVGEDTNGSTQGRVHSLSVYQAEDGEFIVGVQYHSPVADELSDDFIEAVNDLEEVDAALSLYEPAATLKQLPVAQHDVHRRQAAVASLCSRFDRQVANVLGQLNAVEYA